MIRAYIQQGLYGFTVGIAIVNHHGEDGTVPASILRRSPDSARCDWEFVEDHNTTIDPLFELDDASARALLDALTRHYAGAEDTRALRRDYDAERKRVDKLTGAVIDLAATLVVPSPHSEIQQRVHFKENL